MAAVAVFFSPSGYEPYVQEQATWRPYSTAMIVHPKFPQGSLHFVHPSGFLRPEVCVRVPGVPFGLRVSQKQGRSPGDDTGFSVWRAGTVLAAYVAQKVGRCPPGSTAIELGCGAAALSASTAAYVGYAVDATDGSDAILAEARASIAAHRRAAGRNCPFRVDVSRLEWTAEAAERLVARRKRPYDLVLGSEVVYALKTQSFADVQKTFHQLASTLAALLADRGIIIFALNPRYDIEAVFFRLLPSYGLHASPPQPLHDLGLHPDQTHGIKLFCIRRRPENKNHHSGGGGCSDVL